MLTVPQRSKVQSLLKDAKTNVSLKGRSFPDGEETWHLFANWLPIAKSLRLTPHVTTTVEDMGKLLTAIYRWTYDPFVQGCEQIAKRFQMKPVRTPVAILGSLGVCIYVPASRHWLISYSPIHQT